jgi:hypothetical protein
VTGDGFTAIAFGVADLLGAALSGVGLAAFGWGADATTFALAGVAVGDFAAAGAAFFVAGLAADLVVTAGLSAGVLGELGLSLVISKPCR